MPPDERHAYTPAELDAMYREHPVTAIRVTSQLFRWESFQQWVDSAARDFRRARAAGGRFPVRVMRLAEA